MCNKNERRPSLLGSVLTNKCPRCRKGDLFTVANPYKLITTMRMPEHCPICGQPYELQTGFYFGTGYVSYGLSLMICAATFILWALTIGFSFSDNRLFWWIGFNALLLIALQPVLQRLARSIWIACFVRYDNNLQLCDKLG